MAKKKITVIQETGETDFPFFWVRENNHLRKVAWADILYLKSEQHFTQVVTMEKKYTIAASLTATEQKLPPSVFRRVHRSYIVNLTQIEGLNKTEVLINGQSIPLTRTFADALFEDLVARHLLG